MVSKKVKVVNSQGFHMRPVTTFVGAMGNMIPISKSCLREMRSTARA